MVEMVEIDDRCLIICAFMLILPMALLWIIASAVDKILEVLKDGNNTN
jgi:hypothetical protein